MDAVVDWLKENAAAIQALASLAALAVAGLLALLTAKYVRLNRDIAASSLEQIRHLKEAANLMRQQNARALEALALRMRVALGQIGSDAPSHSELRAFSLLTENDIDDLSALARQVNDRTISAATEAAGPLRVIRAMIQKAKVTPSEVGWIPTNQEGVAWKRAVEDAHRHLQEVEVPC